jgi:hypothetical protein
VNEVLLGELIENFHHNGMDVFGIGHDQFRMFISLEISLRFFSVLGLYRSLGGYSVFI